MLKHIILLTAAVGLATPAVAAPNWRVQQACAMQRYLRATATRAARSSTAPCAQAAPSPTATRAPPVETVVASRPQVELGKAGVARR